MNELIEAPGSRLLRLDEAADQLGYRNAVSVRRLIRQGRLEMVRLSSRAVRVLEADVQRLIRELREGSAA